MNLLTVILPRYISELMQAELISNMRNSLYTNSVKRSLIPNKRTAIQLDPESVKTLTEKHVFTT